jgi:hypothetical protein
LRNGIRIGPAGNPAFKAKSGLAFCFQRLSRAAQENAAKSKKNNRNANTQASPQNHISSRFYTQLGGVCDNFF